MTRSRHLTMLSKLSLEEHEPHDSTSSFTVTQGSSLPGGSFQPQSSPLPHCTASPCQGHTHIPTPSHIHLGSTGFRENRQKELIPNTTGSNIKHLQRTYPSASTPEFIVQKHLAK